GARLGITHDAMVVNALAGFGFGVLEDLRRSLVGFSEESISIGIHRARLADLLRQAEADLVDDVKALFIIDEGPTRERHPGARPEDLLQTIEEVHDVHGR